MCRGFFARGRTAGVGLELDQLARDPGAAELVVDLDGQIGRQPTSEKSGRIWMCPKSARRSPPSLAMAPTIWRGSTLWRLPTLIRYVAMGWSVRPRGPRSRAHGSRGADARRAALLPHRPLGRRVEQQRGLALGDDGQGGGDIDLRHVVLTHVVGDDVAEPLDAAGGLQGLGDRVVEAREPGGVDVSALGSCIWLQRLAGRLLDVLEE